MDKRDSLNKRETYKEKGPYLLPKRLLNAQKDHLHGEKDHIHGQKGYGSVIQTKKTDIFHEQQGHFIKQ